MAVYKQLSGYFSGYTITASSTLVGVSLLSTGTIGGSGLLLQKAAGVANYGIIDASGSNNGVSLTVGGLVRNEKSITGFDGVWGSPSSTVDNSGYIGGLGASTGRGVYLQAGSIINRAAGTITGFYGVWGGNATNIDNFGVINGNGAGTGRGVYLLGGQVINRASATITGKVVGILAATGVTNIDNFGTIKGGVSAVVLANSSDHLVAEQGSYFKGVIDGGTATLALQASSGTITGLGYAGASLSGGVTANSITGFSLIDIGEGAWTITGGSNTLASTQVMSLNGALSVAGTLRSAGLIEEGKSFSVSGYFNNTGEAQALEVSIPGETGLAGVNISNGSVVNSGTILGGAATQLYYGYSTIQGGAGGAGAYQSGGYIFNSGVLTGGAGGYGHGATGGAGGAGLDQASAGIAVNYAGHSITGGAGGAASYAGYLGAGGVNYAGGAGGAGAVLDAASNGYIGNLGTITGGTGGTGGILGAGLGTSGAGGVGGAGVSILGGAYAYNQGTIEGGAGGAAGGSSGKVGATGAQGDGVDIAAATNLYNKVGGLITGGIGVYAKAGSTVTVRNGGTITGTKGPSVELKDASDLLVVYSGAVFNGAIQGGGGTLDFMGGTGSLTGLGGSGVFSGGFNGAFSAFGAYAIYAGVVVSLYSTNTLSASDTLSNDGTLIDVGTFEVDGYFKNQRVFSGANGATGANGLAGVTLAGGGSVYEEGAGPATGLYGGSGGNGGGPPSFANGIPGNGAAAIMGSTLGTVTANGVIQGGAGGAGYQMASAAAGPGGTGGAGVVLGGDPIIRITAGGIYGGHGGAGGYNAAPGGAGGDAVDLTAAGQVFVYAKAIGGAGGDGGAGGGTDGQSSGGAGGDGVRLGGAGDVYVYGGAIVIGGAGGKSPFHHVGYNHAGVGGDGVHLSGGGSVYNAGVVTGGAGGDAAYAFANYNDGGNGGDGLRFSGGGQIVNYGTFQGGAGGEAGPIHYGNASSPGVEGDGMDVSGATKVTNHAGGLIEGYTGFYAYAGAAVTLTNAGTITGDKTGTLANAVAVNLTDAKDRLIVDPGAVFNGLVLGAGSTLEFAAGKGTLAASSAYFSGFATTVVDAGGDWTFGGGSSAYTLDNNGTMTIADGGNFYLGGSVTNTGTMVIGSATKLTGLHILNPGVTVSGGGVISLTGSKAHIIGAQPVTEFVNVDNTIVGHGWIGQGFLTLDNQAAGVVEAQGGSLILNTNLSEMKNEGLMEAASGATLVLQGTTIDQTGGGTILALSGGRVVLTGDTVVGGEIGRTGTGLAVVGAGASTWYGAGVPVTVTGLAEVLTGATLTLDGTVDNLGKIDLFAGKGVSDLVIGSYGLTFKGGGQVNLSASLGNRIVGGSVATLDNVNDRIAGAGTIGGGAVTLINESSGQIVGNSALSLKIDTGVNTIHNGGTIASVGTGRVVVSSGIANTGLLLAAAGTLEVDGAVTAFGGSARIVGAGVLDIEGAFAETVVFAAGSTGVVQIADATTFTGSVQGLRAGGKSGSDAIDLTGLAFVSGSTSANFTGTTAGGVLTVSNGTTSVNINLTGDYVGHLFTISDDGSGHVLVKDPPAASSAANLTGAMAAFRPPAAVAAAPLAHAPPARYGLLASHL